MPNKKTILVVDDSPVIRELLSNILLESGYKVVTAVDGATGLRAATSSSFDLIISDINMPGLSGLDMVDMLRQTKAGKSVPIVLLTVNDNVNNLDLRKWGKAHGVIAWLLKPVDASCVVTALARYFSKRKKH